MYNLYDMSIKLTTSTARAQFADLVNRAEYAGERTIVHRRNRPVAAVVPIEDLKRLERLEDEIDLAEARKAMKEKGKSIPWSQVKKELNL
jgi:prevent-host-death family protein